MSEILLFSRMNGHRCRNGEAIREQSGTVTCLFLQVEKKKGGGGIRTHAITVLQTVPLGRLGTPPKPGSIYLNLTGFATKICACLTRLWRLVDAQTKGVFPCLLEDLGNSRVGEADRVEFFGRADDKPGSGYKLRYARPDHSNA